MEGAAAGPHNGRVPISAPQNSVQTGGAAPSATGSFDVVRRGYDRDQVDARTREWEERLAAAEKARAIAEQHARATEGELRTARASGDTAAAPPESFGFRAEKILRLAEHEAADVRSRAATEAAAVLEQARADAEQHRHEVEQSLIARSSELEQDAAQRTVVLQEREEQAAATLAAARDEAARATEEARRTVDGLVAEAQNRADEVRHRSEQELGRRRDGADAELRRIGGLHENVRTEMARLHALLTGELSRDGTAGGNGSARQAART